MISERVKIFIEKYNLKEPFLVAFSGGYDSMCLLNVLYELKHKVVAIHLNHNWRGEESFKEEINCKNFAKSLGIQFYSETLSDDIAHTETAAREARYDFFERCAKKFKSNVIFTAHNLNDNAETVLYRIIKGTGPTGLQGISEKRDIYYRPLLSTTREEIEDYCNQKALKPNNDSSNKNIKYKRNLIREKILPIMKEINPNVIRAINSLSELSCENLESLKYKIRQMLIDNNIDYDRKKIEDVLEFYKKNSSSKSGKIMSLSDKLLLFVNNKEAKVISKSEKSFESITINKEGEYKFADHVYSIKKIAEDIKQFPKDSEMKAIISIDRIDFTLRFRRDGDVISPLGVKGTQKLKKYLNEKKIPNYKKDSIPLLCSGNDVLWVCGYGISDKIKVNDKPTHIIERLK